MVNNSPINPEDIVEVTNIDINCELLDPEIHIHGKNIATVRYDNIPHDIEVGKTRLFPGYLAVHYAKHLVDHILTARKKPTNDAILRPKLINEILGDIKESFSSPVTKTPGEVTAEKVQEVNKERELPAMDVGTDSNPTGEVAPAEVLPETYNGGVTEVKEPPTNAELRAELDQLGIKWNITDNKETLMAKIKEFASV